MTKTDTTKLDKLRRALLQLHERLDFATPLLGEQLPDRAVLTAPWPLRVVRVRGCDERPFCPAPFS